MENKETILAKAKTHVRDTLASLEESGRQTAASLSRSKAIYKTLSEADKIVERQLMKYGKKRIGEIAYLEKSPYFVRCDVIWEKEQEVKSIFFGKFGFSEKEIYSWITPASTIRYENPGPVNYVRPDGVLQRANLVRKDQYMIVGGQIKFLATESLESPRQLVYQEYFSNRKTGFVLPEIVAQMEKAQDQVIRAHHQGPFLISGPAGSGKTTLALHRVAYLVQAPDLANIYTSDAIVVFVQDNGTKEYFSHLLPELGIDDVLITTFSEWAIALLGIDARSVVRPGKTESERDAYEYAKLQALREAKPIPYRKSALFSLLAQAYDPFFDQQQKRLFQEQKKEKTVDRIDLTLLLGAYHQTSGALGVIKDYWVELRNGSERKKRGFVPFDYALAVVDEFQNYLPEQLTLIKSCVNRKSQSILYVGDMAQQVQLGTVRNWGQIGEHIDGERKVILQKVYRNTRSILEYIQGLGYAIAIPEGIKEGSAVGEHLCADAQDEISRIRELLSGKDFASIGILAKNSAYLGKHRQAFADDARVHVMTMHEAQGVEFDGVFLVGIDEETFAVTPIQDASELFMTEKKRINTDLLYVALTRAICELHVLGKKSLAEVVV